MLYNHGMMAPSCHVGMDRLRADARAITKICKDLGIETIFAPAPLVGERDGGEPEWRALGKELAQLGKAVNAEGLAFGWHNHNWEYQRRWTADSTWTSCSQKRQTSSGKLTLPGSRVAAPIPSLSLDATRVVSLLATSRISLHPGNVWMKMVGLIRATACSIGTRCRQ
jgi:hypothetical protein